MNRILKEPLFHFLILGALLYFASIVFGNKSEQMQTIIVSEGKINQLSTLYKKTWQRAPTLKELENVVDEYVLEQAAYLEGIKLGLDKNDIVIVRRVHQKLDFLAEEDTPLPEASDAVLLAYLHDHAKKFRSEAVYSIRQIYFDPNNRTGSLNQKYRQILNVLQQNPDQDISSLGDRYVFKPAYKNIGLSQIQGIFGKKFAKEVNQSSLGLWLGPIQSGFGIHLVYIDEKQVGRLPALDKIRRQVLNEWENDFKVKSAQHYYDELLKRYPVIIHWPEKNDSL